MKVAAQIGVFQGYLRGAASCSFISTYASSPCVVLGGNLRFAIRFEET